MIRIAALLTCHNRRALTLTCLRSLSVAVPQADVFLTDDGSTDGTAEAVAAEFPAVHILPGDGTLYWCRGMHRAWCEAAKGDYDYYLWLNDDLTLCRDALDELLGSLGQQGGMCVISGLVADATSGEVVYGGYDHARRLLQPAPAPQPLWLMNGNVVLVPREVVERVGILDPYFHHDLGDLDYGLRAQALGIAVCTSRRVVATGHRNDVCRVRRRGTDLIGRFRALRTPLGSPLSQNFVFRSRHFGLLHALIYCAHLVWINVLPDWAVSTKKYR